jgi:uncharacterized protein YjiS (DUF1127 family)
VTHQHTASIAGVYIGTTIATSQYRSIETMNVHVTKEEVEFHLPTMMTHYFQDEPECAPRIEERRPGLFARLKAGLCWITEIRKRQAAIEELNRLSDRDLADIGVSRADLPRLFDPAFAPEWEARRRATT